MNKLKNQTEFLSEYGILESDYQTTGLDWGELEKIYDDHLRNIPFWEMQLSALFSVFIKIPRVHSIRYRVKKPEHLIEKIIRKKIKDNNRNITFNTYISEIDDIIGIRILHLFKDEWIRIHEVLKDYDLKESPKAYYREGDGKDYLEEYKNHCCELAVHEYGYRSVHYIIQQKILNNKIACEVQVRTIFEEAWSEIDHTIRYPYDMDNPIFKQYLMIVNRLSGSADEMGSFLVYLKEHLATIYLENQRENVEKDTLINDLRQEIVELKMSKEKRKSINGKIDKLTNEKIKPDPLLNAPWIKPSEIELPPISMSDKYPWIKSSEIELPGSMLDKYPWIKSSEIKLPGSILDKYPWIKSSEIGLPPISMSDKYPWIKSSEIELPGSMLDKCPWLKQFGVELSPTSIFDKYPWLKQSE